VAQEPGLISLGGAACADPCVRRAGELDGAIEFYEKLLGVENDMYMSIPPDPADPRGGLTLATVGGFLILEGSPEQLAPFLATAGTLLVDDIGPYFARLTAQGAKVVHPPAERLGGAGFTVRHPGRHHHRVRASPPVGR
jgi:predicted enzyme related to lactoylglutathione lyase